jgi:2-haloacid dehalogenase
LTPQPDCESAVKVKKSLKCLVFDAYGTVFDVHSITTALDRRFPGQGLEVSKDWRTRQLEYTWLRSLMNRYEDFWKITESALVATCNAMSLPLDPPARAELMEAYLSLKPFPEVKQTLGALLKIPKAILSNGNPKMLEDVVRNARLEGAFSHLISVDEVKTYKPSLAAYQLAVKKMCADAESIGFVSSNFFDVAGAKVFGFRTYWINRSDSPPEELGVTPDAMLKSLGDLIGLVKP